MSMMADTTSPPAAFKALTACFLGTPVCCITMMMSFSSRLVSSSAPETLICYICKNSVSKCAVTCSLNVVMKCSQSLVLIAWRTTWPLQNDPDENDDQAKTVLTLCNNPIYRESNEQKRERGEGTGEPSLSGPSSSETSSLSPWDSNACSATVQHINHETWSSSWSHVKRQMELCRRLQSSQNAWLHMCVQLSMWILNLS